MRHRSSEACFPPAARAALLGRIVGGEHISDVCVDLGISVNRARSYGRHAPAWGRALALRAGCDPDLEHGTARAYRCRCPHCWAAKAARR
ncbi:hypothetical protein [Streptomyces minutiscleroticus]|uniref:hypothetical protein n=1 Tax=Streptomyces minutiscleroticus TaxID=68238 RepID=UPI003325BFFD